MPPRFPRHQPRSFVLLAGLALFVGACTTAPIAPPPKAASRGVARDPAVRNLSDQIDAVIRAAEADLFPEAQPPVHPDWRRVTVRQLVEHRAGLRDHFVRFGWAMRGGDDETAQRRRYALSILSRPPDFAPGSAFVYNSTDYLI